LDLSADIETIFAQLPKSTRRKITTATSQGLSTRLGDASDLPIFYELICATARRGGYEPRKFDYYEAEWNTFFKNGQALLLLAFYAGQPVAAHISYGFGKQATLFHQASADGFCALNPNTLLVWESLKLLKTGGCANFDLGSVPNEIGEIACQGQPPDHERSDGLWGPDQFKSDFCKQIVYYTGAYDYVYQPVLYALINSHFLKTEILERPGQVKQ
jgi:lipid II:glycine glycyltransferase (peptidoglycan interpeptide bridge formation enzyme)